MKKTVVELFAGVGGFRVGLNAIREFDSNGQAIENKNFDFVWSNQWEPATKTQHAFDCYNTRFNDSHNLNIDISTVDKNKIPDHTLLCGGFPCQDYSVAHSKSTEKGIEGKKGVLWWQIYEILSSKCPPFVLLENVDRLLKSPSTQRGRDFGIMLRCFADLNYDVQWRVINAADYGFPQRRRRVYIFAYKKNTCYSNYIRANKNDVLTKIGMFSKVFPVSVDNDKINNISLYENYEDLLDISNSFSYDFRNNGLMIDGIVYTVDSKAVEIKTITLENIVEHNVDSHYFLTTNEIEKFKYLRGSKKIKRISPEGKEYYYSEGAMSEYDDLSLPGRTMLTSEGTVNRSTHIIKDLDTGKLRRLTPVECERLNQFPDNWTNTGMPEKRRYFMMGNALVCGIIENIGKEIEKIIAGER